MLVKKADEYREDIIVIVDGPESNIIINAYLIDLKNLKFISIDLSDIELVQEEF
jgi:hypothetical protein